MASARTELTGPDFTRGVAAADVAEGCTFLGDRVEIDGDLGAHDCTVRYFERGRLAAVAAMGRDRESLVAEAAMEHALGDHMTGALA